MVYCMLCHMPGMQEGALPGAREHVSLRPDRPSAHVRDTPCTRKARVSPTATTALALAPLSSPRCQQERLLRALCQLPPGIAFLAQVLYLVVSVMKQHHEQVALVFPPCFFLGVQSFS